MFFLEKTFAPKKLGHSKFSTPPVKAIDLFLETIDFSVKALHLSIETIDKHQDTVSLSMLTMQKLINLWVHMSHKHQYKP